MVKAINKKPNILERRRMERQVQIVKGNRSVKPTPEPIVEERTYNNRHKYIRIRDYGFITWPVSEDITHRDMYERMGCVEGDVVSAGFVTFIGGAAYIEGRSESLNVDHHPSDREAIARQFGLPLELNVRENKS